MIILPTFLEFCKNMDLIWDEPSTPEWELWKLNLWNELNVKYKNIQKEVVDDIISSIDKFKETKEWG